MAPEKLRDALDQLFGRTWTAVLVGHFLGVRRRTVLKWLAGEAPIPASVALGLNAVDSTRLEWFNGSPSAR